MSGDLRSLFAHGKGAAATARILPLDAFASAAPAAWGLDALRGRVVEFSAATDSAVLTAAAALVLEAQQIGEPVAWITLPASQFYPQDMQAHGIDLAALVVVRAADVAVAIRATERLLRSGGFGLVVLDFAGLDAVTVPEGRLGRLVTLAQTHDASAVCLTEKPRDVPSLGSLISLRGEPLQRYGEANLHHVHLEILKDKQAGPGDAHDLACCGPGGY